MAAEMLALSELSNLLDEKNETTEIQSYPSFLNCKKVEWKEIAVTRVNTSNKFDGRTRLSPNEYSCMVAFLILDQGSWR